MTLKDLAVGHSAVIESVGGDGTLRQHFLDMGLIPGASVKVTKLAPMGDPMELQIQGYILTLRKAEADHIVISETDAPQESSVQASDLAYIDSLHEHNSHPGLGEAGKYHNHEDENPLPKDTVLTFALVGEQNSGKTTLFNQLTGSSQHVGNFPGVTVATADAPIKGHPDTLVTDLPGISSLSIFTSQEELTRNFFIDRKPMCIINVVDASNIERNLYLTTQLMEVGIPMVLALNMMDEVAGNGGSVRVNEMEKMLGLPVVAISAARNEGISELVEHALHIARYQEKPVYVDMCDSSQDGGGAVHRCIHGIRHLVEDHAEAAGLSSRFAASKIIEGDAFTINALGLSQNELEMCEHIILQMEEERGLDRQAAMADMRFRFIHSVCQRTVVKPVQSREYLLSRRIDKVLTGRWTALPILVAIMFLVIWLSIDVIGAPLQDLMRRGIGLLGNLCLTGMQRLNVSPAVTSLVTDGIFRGVGSVLSFLPLIIVLFFFLSIIEDSGYMARVAFVTDKLLRKLGLSGRSIVPLLIGFGCSVPAVMATRTLPSARDRKKTVLLTPFMSCSAKITVYAFLTSAFFPQHAGLVLAGLYLLAIVTGIFVALVSKHVWRGSEAAPFVMEMPNYRFPSLKSVGHLLWDKTKDFLQMAFTVIFVASIVIWLLQSFDFRFQMVTNGEGSMLASIAGLIAPIFKPMGLDDWRIVTALISGFMAKESVASTLEVLGATSVLTVQTAVPLLVFCLLYTPCVAAIAAIRRELGRGWALFVVVFQCCVAWVASFVFAQAMTSNPITVAIVLVISAYVVYIISRRYGCSRTAAKHHSCSGCALSPFCSKH